MDSRRKHTTIIGERAAVFATFIRCNKKQQRAAKIEAEKKFNQGSSGANAICLGFEKAREMKRLQHRFANHFLKFQKPWQMLPFDE